MKNYTNEEHFIVEGDRDVWFEKCQAALSTLTKDIQVRKGLWEIEGKWGEWLPPRTESISILLFPMDGSRTRIQIKGCVDVSIDWIVLTLGYAAFLHNKVPAKFKNALA